MVSDLLIFSFGIFGILLSIVAMLSSRILPYVISGLLNIFVGFLIFEISTSIGIIFIFYGLYLFLRAGAIK